MFFYTRKRQNSPPTTSSEIGSFTNLVLTNTQNTKETPKTIIPENEGEYVIRISDIDATDVDNYIQQLTEESIPDNNLLEKDVENNVIEMNKKV